VPVLVALSRMYRGEHHPTDVLGSVLFSALWLTAGSLLMKPNADSRQARRRPRSLQEPVARSTARLAAD
jgi:undecaprenyl-diphosphatase